MDAESLAKIIKDNKIDVKSTKPVPFTGLYDSTRIFKVDREDLTKNLYIIDTEQGMKIACHPHIIGDRLDYLTLHAALETERTLREILNIDYNNVVIEHVLRAGPGYNLHRAISIRYRLIEYQTKHMIENDVPMVYVRPKYVEKSYRNHTTRELKLVYKDFSQMPKNKDIVLIKPDTEATGMSGKLSIEEAVMESSKMGSKITDVVLYGFMAAPGIKLLDAIARRHNIKLHAFAIGNITELASNNYDMTLYGVDESHYQKTGEIKKLGSIVDRNTLKRYLPSFVPGSDQPGNWSSRQSRLFTGELYEDGEIEEHIKKSVELIEHLRKISNYEDWQDEIASRELVRLRKTLKIR